MSEYLTRRNTVLESLRAGRRKMYRLWVQAGSSGSKEMKPILKEARACGVPIEEAKKGRLSQVVGATDHQGVILEVDDYPYVEVHDILDVAAARDEKPLVVIFDLIHGIYNIGTLLRTAEICGFHGVIIQDRRAPDITPAVVQHSVGAAEHLAIAKVTNIVQAIETLQENEVWIAGMDMGADAERLGRFDLDMSLGIVVGHEGDGLRRLVRERCDFVLQLPMRGNVASLNAGVAGSVMMYAAWQARGFTGANWA